MLDYARLEENNLGKLQLTTKIEIINKGTIYEKNNYIINMCDSAMWMWKW